MTIEKVEGAFYYLKIATATFFKLVYDLVYKHGKGGL